MFIRWKAVYRPGWMQGIQPLQTDQGKKYAGRTFSGVAGFAPLIRGIVLGRNCVERNSTKILFAV